MVENQELLSTVEVCQLLGINANNLHQIQHRGTLKWVKRDNRKVYYEAEAVRAYHEKRLKRGKKSE